MPRPGLGRHRRSPWSRVVVLTGVDFSSSRGRWSVTCSPCSVGCSSRLLHGRRRRGAAHRQHHGVHARLLLDLRAAAARRLPLGRRDLVGYDSKTWLQLLALTLGAQLLGHSLFNLVLRTTSPTVVSLALLFEVPGAALIAAVFLGQSPPLAVLPAGAAAARARLVISARAATPRRRRCRPNEPSLGSPHRQGRKVHPMGESRRLRSRRSCLAVPGSSPKMLGKAQGLPADQVFLDLEDSVAPLAKEDARANIVAALNDGDWAGKTPRRAGQRLDHAVDLPRRHRRRRGRRRQPRRGDAAEGADAPSRSSRSTCCSPRSRRRSGSRSAASASRRRSRTRAGWSRSTRSRPRRRGWRPSSSGRPTSWRRSTCARSSSGNSRRATTSATPTTTS